MAKKSTRWIGFHDDTDEKGIVRDILLDQFDVNALQDEVVFFNKVSGHLIALDEEKFSEEEILKRFFVHKPDLIVKSVIPQIIVEIDGPVHWENSRAVKRTNARNCHYERAKLRFVWFTYDEVMNSVKSQVSLINFIVKLGEGIKIMPRMLREGPQVIDKDKKINQIRPQNRSILGRTRPKAQT